LQRGCWEARKPRAARSRTRCPLLLARLPTGFLVLRSVCVSAVFGVATALAARAGADPAAAHQVALQLWLSSSLLADALAVSCQALVAAEIAAGRLAYARALVRATLVLGAGLGLLLGGVLFGTADVLPLIFTRDADVLVLLKPLMHIVAVTQPINTMAFVLDGVLYGAGGFR
jgi:Na+-driven multidrug efflux pump